VQALPVFIIRTRINGGGYNYWDYINAGINGLGTLLNDNYQCYMFINNIASSLGSNVGSVMNIIMNNSGNVNPHAGYSPDWGADAWATANMSTGEIDLWNVGSISGYTIQEISQGLLHELIHIATQSYDIEIAEIFGFQYSQSLTYHENTLEASSHWDNVLASSCTF